MAEFNVPSTDEHMKDRWCAFISQTLGCFTFQSHREKHLTWMASFDQVSALADSLIS